MIQAVKTNQKRTEKTKPRNKNYLQNMAQRKRKKKNQRGKSSIVSAATKPNVKRMKKLIKNKKTKLIKAIFQKEVIGSKRRVLLQQKERELRRIGVC